MRVERTIRKFVQKILILCFSSIIILQILILLLVLFYNLLGDWLQRSDNRQLNNSCSLATGADHNLNLYLLLVFPISSNWLLGYYFIVLIVIAGRILSLHWLGFFSIQCVVVLLTPGLHQLDDFIRNDVLLLLAVILQRLLFLYQL